MTQANLSETLFKPRFKHTENVYPCPSVQSWVAAAHAIRAGR